MKDHQVIRVTKLLKLTDVGIKPSETNWAQVKMPNERWISCIHRRSKPGVFHGSPSMSSSSSSGSSDKRYEDWIRNSKQNKHEYDRRHQKHANGLSPCKPLYSTPVKSKPAPGLPRHPGRHAPASSLGSASPRTQSSGLSPSPNSVHLTRKPSSLSNTSSSSSSSTMATNSFVHDDFDPSSLSSTWSRMKHSTSSYDLSSARSHNHHFSDHRRLSAKDHYDNHGSPQCHHHPQEQQHQHKTGKSDKTTLDDSYVGVSSVCGTVENVITIIDSAKGYVINCQTSLDTSSAQISPTLEVIAVSNLNWLAFYSIETNDCLGTLQLPGRTRHWGWAGGETIGIICENQVLHARVNIQACHIGLGNKATTTALRPIFQIDDSIKSNQITGYHVDPVFGNWCAITSLYVDDLDEIAGRVQVYSHAYGQSQCIDAHSAIFSPYHFGDSERESTLLIAVNREREGSWKLHIIELGPIPTGNRNHRAKTITLASHKQARRDSQASPSGLTESAIVAFDDIPTNLACDPRLGVVYVLSKYGSLYVCDVETGVALHYERLGPKFTHDSALFAFAYNAARQALTVLTRAGRVFEIKVDFNELVEATRATGKQTVNAKVMERIGRKMEKISMVRSKSETRKVDDDGCLSASTTQPASSPCSSSSFEISSSERTPPPPPDDETGSLAHLHDLAHNFHQHLQINPKEERLDFAMLSRELSVDEIEEITRL